MSQLGQVGAAHSAHGSINRLELPTPPVAELNEQASKLVEHANQLRIRLEAIETRLLGVDGTAPMVDAKSVPMVGFLSSMLQQLYQAQQSLEIAGITVARLEDAGL